MLLKLIISVFLLIGLYLRLTTAGYCTEAYSCSSTCTRSTKYKTRCGLFGWGRCNRYRTVNYGCTKTCYRRVCCNGYTGSQCNSPICHGLTFCYNGGTCASPNKCRCAAGFTGSQCQTDVNECERRTAGCAENCTNTFGSFQCSCIRPGYILGSDRKSCVDQDECQTGVAECEHECSNTVGSYTCSCREGYDLALDKKSCEVK